MTLAEIANFVCQKIGQTEGASVSACKAFINARWNQVWDAASWRESLAMVNVVSQALDPSQIILPQQIARVMAIRSSDNNGSLGALELNTLFQYDPTLWDSTGTVSFFSTLEPTVIPKLPPGGNDLVVATTQGFVRADGATGAEVEPDFGIEVYFQGRDSRIHVVEETTPLVSFLTGVPSNIVYYAETAGFQYFSELLAVTKGVTTNGIYLNWAENTFDFSTAAYMGPAETNAPKFERIKVMNPPTSTATFLVLGKRRIVPLLDDNSQAALRNCDNVLIAMAHGDMLERQRQYQKAQAKFSEAKEQLGILLDIERNQAASNIRIIPAEIHGQFGLDDTFGSAGKGFY